MPPTADYPVPTGTPDGLKDGSAHHRVPVDGEKFALKVDYWTTVDSTTWGAVGREDVHLLAYLDPAAGSTTPAVMLDRFASAFALRAANHNVDAVVLAQFEDHADAAVPGFLITPTLSYGTQFSTAGVSPDLAARWQMLAPGEQLSEGALQQAGVYAVQVTMTFYLLVRNAGDAGWHRRVVVDELTVPVRKALAPLPTTSVPLPTASAPLPTASAGAATATG